MMSPLPLTLVADASVARLRGGGGGGGCRVDGPPPAGLRSYWLLSPYSSAILQLPSNEERSGAPGPGGGHLAGRRTAGGMWGGGVQAPPAPRDPPLLCPSVSSWNG